MRLHRLLENVDVLDLTGDPATVEIASVAYRADTAGPGALYCCVPGTSFDGHDFTSEAVGRGAVALLAERPLPGVPAESAVQVIVTDTRTAMARAADMLHGRPSREIAVAGVTGTNGKTTTTHLLASALKAAGRPTEVIGTLSGPRTTPESPDLQLALAAARDRGAQAVALEVSSHALALRRVEATWFAVAVFTNLSSEHLDFHPDVDDYFRTKATLFDPDRAAEAVVNADDPWGRRLIEQCRLPTRTFTLDDAHDLAMAPAGISFRWQGEPVRLPPGGPFAVSNALAAATAAAALGADAGAIARGLSDSPQVPGRFEPVEAGQPFTLVVDYAHTPGGLEAALSAARAIAGDGHVLVVFGCGGDRDRSKRPAMGEVAARLADRVIVTDDNPRSENPTSITDQILEGVPGERRRAVEVVPDRRGAIALAIGEARAGDVVVVAGKGHETVQVAGDRSLPFDDRVVAREELVRAGAGRV